jgi:hypothetical protein
MTNYCDAIGQVLLYFNMEKLSPTASCLRNLTMIHFTLRDDNQGTSRSQWPRGLRRELSSPARTLGSCVRIPLKKCMSVCVR